MTLEADKLGVGCYFTTATPSNVSWYGRFGFEVSEQWGPRRGGRMGGGCGGR